MPTIDEYLQNNQKEQIDNLLYQIDKAIGRSCYALTLSSESIQKLAALGGEDFFTYEMGGMTYKGHRVIRKN